jgi:hypothetical protein
MQEDLPKTADVYRGAVAVLCLVSTIASKTCEVVRRGVQIMATDAYADLNRVGDTYGCYLFSTAKGNTALCSLFEHRWWERAWTFQETVVNSRTYLIGPLDDTIPIDHALRLALVVRRRAASLPTLKETQQLGRPTTFWDSVAAMEVASKRTLSLGEAISCVWRRSSEKPNDLIYSMIGVCGLVAAIQPSYEKDVFEVLRELFNAAGSSGDYTWLSWSGHIDHCRAENGMGLVPTPEYVRAASTTGITAWRTSAIPSELVPREGSSSGVVLPYKSTGVIRSYSEPKSIHDVVSHLRDLKHSDGEIWDMLFGIRVGLIDDIGNEVDNDGIASAALHGALTLIEQKKPRTDVSDLSGSYPWLSGYTIMNYCVRAAEPFLADDSARFAIVSSQGATAIIPASYAISAGTKSRIYVLPLEAPKDESRRIGFITLDGEPFRARAVALVLLNSHAGSGAWQVRMIG